MICGNRVGKLVEVSYIFGDDFLVFTP